MAYAAVVSLAQTINRLQKYSDISIRSSFPEIIEFEYAELVPLQQILQSLDRSRIRSERLNTLDGEIREAAFKLEDVIEIHVSNQLHSHRSEDSPPFSICIDLKELKQDLDSFTHTVKTMKEAYIEELSMTHKVDDDDAAVPSSPGSGETKSKMVGLSNLLWSVKYVLTRVDLFVRNVALYGMAGIGKTTFATEIFYDPEIIDYFESCAWVRVGPRYELRETLLSILSQLNHETNEMLSEEGDEEIAEHLCKSLQCRRALIVLDDMWDSHVSDYLTKLLPRDDNGSRVLLTSTIQEVADQCAGFSGACKLPFLNKEESWRLLREKVFGEEESSSCPFELERAGKKIAEKCDGLPLLIVTVAGILSKAEKTVEYWNEVAEKRNSVFTDAYDQVSKSLLPSYNYLPQNTKACFLYMGILPQNNEISRSKLINLWSAEGFLGPNDGRKFELLAMECLEELVSRNVVILRQKVSDLPETNHNTEKYHLHSTYLHLCVKEASKNKFYHVLNCYAEDAEQSMESQRRLCIQNNVVFAIKDLYDLMSSISAARSLFCTGPFHRYPVPICFGLTLLRVLDSLTIRFYKFPIEVLELINLRYLAMTYDGQLPASISKLWNLECLIINRHIGLKTPGVPSYMPMEIWDMKELIHLQVMGSDLPDPCETSLLPNLLTLLDVSAHSCTQGVLKRIPNLRRLGIRTELRTCAAEPVSCFDHIPDLNGLQTLALIMDPVFTSKIVAPPPPPSINDSHLGKLSLSGLGYPWEYMRLMASLPNLKVLKLRCNACRGSKWETPPEGFQCLEYLLIEDSDLVVWVLGKHGLRFLRRLSLKHCYRLKEIPERLERSLRKIEVIDCNPSAVSWAKNIKHVNDVYVESSWE